MRTVVALALLLIPAAEVMAQTAPAPRRFIRASGSAVITSRPDQAEIDFSVVTQASTAQDASTRNAEVVANVIAQLRAVLGANADIRTVNYSLTPNYTVPRDGTPPTLTGYTANNTVEVTTGDLSIIGRLIDTAVQAGANRVQGLRFSLKDDQSLRAQALRQAAQAAKVRAEAIAAGLAVRLGAPLMAEEGVSVRPLTDTRTVALAPTPIEPGTVDVRAVVTVEFEIS